MGDHSAEIKKLQAQLKRARSSASTLRKEARNADRDCKKYGGTYCIKAKKVWKTYNSQLTTIAKIKESIRKLKASRQNAKNCGAKCLDGSSCRRKVSKTKHCYSHRK